MYQFENEQIYYGTIRKHLNFQIFKLPHFQITSFSKYCFDVLIIFDSILINAIRF